MRNLTSPAFFCVLLLAAVAPALGQDEQKTGHFQATFEERSPHSDKDKLGDRVGIGPDQRKEYDLSTVTFDLYVPEAYKPDAGYGLVVFLASRDNARPYPDWDKVLDKRKLLWVGVPAFDPEAGFIKHLGSALDAAHNMSKQYKLDASRVYVAGVAGPMGASILGPHFPDVFGGGGLYMMGSRFFKPTQGPGENGAQLGAEFRAPDAQTLAAAKKAQRYVWITGATSTDLGPRDKAAHAGYKAEGFEKLELIEIPEQGNVVPSPPFFEAGLTRLDDMKNGADTVTVIGGENRDPNAFDPSRPQPTPLKTGEFKIKFDKRSPHSEPRTFNRLWKTGRGDDYDLGEVSFQMYVPEDYEHGQPYGLMVSMSSSSEVDDGQILHPGWRTICDKQRLIWIGASGTNPKTEALNRIGPALDAVLNVRMQYTIDDDRIYSVGLGDGAISACQLVLGYPDVFDGGLFMQGGGFYRDLTEGNRRLVAGFPPPPNSSMRDAKQRSRLCFIAGGQGQLKELVDLIRVKGYENDGFRFVLFVNVDNLGNNVPGGVSFGKGIEEMDKVLAGSDRPLLAIASRLERAGRLGEAWLAYAKVAQRTDSDKRREQAEEAIAKLREKRDQRIVAAKNALAAGKTDEAKVMFESIIKDFEVLATDEPARWLALEQPPRVPGAGDPRGGGRPGDKPPGGFFGTGGGRSTDAPNDGDKPDATPDDAPPASTADPRVEALAQRRFDAAKRLAESNVVVGYRELREIAERFANTQAGAAAKQAADAIWADDARRKQIVDREARQLLVIARRYLDAGNTASAKEKLTQLLEQYPDADAAKAAKELLDGIK